MIRDSIKRYNPEVSSHRRAVRTARLSTKISNTMDRIRATKTGNRFKSKPIRTIKKSARRIAQMGVPTTGGLAARLAAVRGAGQAAKAVPKTSPWVTRAQKGKLPPKQFKGGAPGNFNPTRGTRKSLRAGYASKGR
jgi:hypothetical protein